MTFVSSLPYSHDNDGEMRQEELGAGEGAGSGGPAQAQGLQWAARQLLLLLPRTSVVPSEKLASWPGARAPAQYRPYMCLGMRVRVSLVKYLRPPL